uniref:Uncharacterized protein n=1 Tax=Mola mola TaxID=94237 RepID=A0A3Q4BQ29_MOLML
RRGDTIQRPGPWYWVEDKIDRPDRLFTTDNLARAEWSIFDAEARGLSSGYEASTGGLSARAFAKAELAGASASAGALKATFGLSADTVVEIGLKQLEAKVLGPGVTLGHKVAVSLFGTRLEFKLR